jgi:hypothetical protein
MFTVAEIVKDCTSELEWKSSSQWATPHPNDLYTTEIKVYGSSLSVEYASFHISRMRLILCLKVCCVDTGTVETVYYDMGEFVEPISSSLTQLEHSAERIKEYAAYVIQGFKKDGDLRHCPSYTLMDDVDDNFNPIP